MHTTACMCVSQGERSGKKNTKRRKENISQYHPCCTCIHLECLHIFGCKYVYKKTCCPSQKLTLKPVNNPFTKFINVKEGLVFPFRWKKTQRVCAISLSTKYNCSGVEIILRPDKIMNSKLSLN